MFEHILFPTDGSEDSELAKECVKNLALKYGAEVTILHAYEFSESIILHRYDIAHTYANYTEKHEKELSQKLMNVLQKEFESAGISVKTQIEKGKAGSVIADWAQHHDCDLIIMGARGLGAINRLLLGSTSNYVLHHANCSVMIVPGSEDKTQN